MHSSGLKREDSPTALALETIQTGMKRLFVYLFGLAGRFYDVHDSKVNKFRSICFYLGVVLLLWVRPSEDSSLDAFDAQRAHFKIWLKSWRRL